MTDDQTPANESNQEPEPDYQGTATYCPEDNKLRLYVGRVPRPDYDRLRAAGWVATPKQDCDFAVVWTPDREAMALEFAEIIEDEDQGPEERAADRAERFGEYREKRAGEAGGYADTYEGQPGAHGFQSQARAERSARRHDRTGTRAVSAWSKAEYWQRRTAGVIEHALYKSAPGVRMGRIKTLESELRKIEARYTEYAKTWNDWQQFAAIADPDEQTQAVRQWLRVNNDYPNNYQHPTHPESVTDYRREHGTYLSSLIDEEATHPITGAQACEMWLGRHGEPADSSQSQWANHLRLRLAYENQMLEAQGGRAAHVEMEPGGWIIGGRYQSEKGEWRQVQKVNKSHVTGRVVSVLVRDNRPSSTNHYGNPYPDGKPRLLSHTIETERLDPDAYRAPTDQERAAFIADKKARKAAAPKVETIPLVNPTDADAERLQAIWNAEKRSSFDDREPAEVRRMTQTQYSANSGGNYAAFETVELTGGGEIRENHWRRPLFPAVAKIRKHRRSVIIITDKPQKAFAANVWHDPRPEVRARLIADPAEVPRVVGKALGRIKDLTPEENATFEDAQRVGFVRFDSLCQIYVQGSFHEAVKNAPAVPEVISAPTTEAPTTPTREERAPVISAPPATVQPDLFNLDAAIVRARSLVAA